MGVHIEVPTLRIEHWQCVKAHDKTGFGLMARYERVPGHLLLK
jgi:hypothetical protein